MRGPAPTPTALRLLKGNPSKEPINREEPKPKASSGKPPSWLPAPARRYWRQLIPILQAMHVMTEADEQALALLCQEMAVYVECQRQLQKTGRTFEFKPRPEVDVANQALANVMRLMDRFGLNPAYRSKLKAELPKEVMDPLEELRQRAKDRKAHG